MGQAKKKRDCPATGRVIGAAECGENRISRYACPESCAFNPFAAANYDAHLEIETRLDSATMEELAKAQENPIAVAEKMRTAGQTNPNHGSHALIVWLLFFQRDASGRTFAERWSAAGLSKLRNDERVLLGGKRQMRVALLEIRRIVDDRQFEAVDLLATDRTVLRFVDRSVAATTVRFATLLTWIYPTPHFWRLSGTGMSVNDIAPLPPREVLDECVRQLGGPEEIEAKRRWLAEQFARIDDVLTATGRERRRQMFLSMDGMFGSADYDLAGPFAECHAALAADPAVEHDDLDADEAKKGFTAALVWQDSRPAPAMMPGRRLLGRILLGPRALRVDAIGGARLDDLRGRVEARLGSRIRFSKERRDDLAGVMLAKEPPADLSLVPPRLLENPTRFDFASSRLVPPPIAVDRADYEAATLAEQRRQLLEERVPALEDRTPRQAAAEPALRGRLVEWAKSIVRQHDRRNLGSGRTDDINGFVRELGLSEIDVPAPPLRPIPDDLDETESEDEFDELEPEDDFTAFNEAEGRVSDWSAPPLPERPLSAKEVRNRLTAALDAFGTAGAAIAEIQASGSTVLDDVWTLCAPAMDEDQYGTVVVFVVQIWFGLVPRGRAPVLRFPEMAAEFERQLEVMSVVDLSPKRTFGRLLEGSPQPRLLEAVAAQLLESAESAPREIRLNLEATMHALVALKVLIGELDRALRQ